MAKLHRKLPLPLRRGPQLRRKAKHAVQTAIGIEGEILRADVRLADDGIPFVQQADDVALELVGRRDGRLHQGFQDLGFGHGEGLAERLLRGGLEGHFAGIRHVGRAVVDDHLRAQDAVADQGPLFARGLEPLVAREEVFLRDVAAFDFFAELVGFEGAGRFHPAHDAGEVAGASGLLFERVVEGDPLGERFAVGDLGLACFAGDAVLTAHSLHVDVEVEFPHARDNSFVGFQVNVDAEGGIFALEAGHCFGEVLEILVVLGFDG